MRIASQIVERRHIGFASELGGESARVRLHTGEFGTIDGNVLENLAKPGFGEWRSFPEQGLERRLYHELGNPFRELGSGAPQLDHLLPCQPGRAPSDPDMLYPPLLKRRLDRFRARAQRTGAGLENSTTPASSASISSMVT